MNKTSGNLNLVKIQKSGVPVFGEKSCCSIVEIFVENSFTMTLSEGAMSWCKLFFSQIYYIYLVELSRLNAA